MSTDKSSPSGAADDREVREITAGIEQTRAQMSATLGALEHRLSPAELGQKAKVELDHVEARVKVAVKESLTEAKGLIEGQLGAAKGMLEEQIQTAKSLVREEIGEAKSAVKEQLHEAKDLVTQGLSDARQALKKDIETAIATTKQGVRDATIGRVENIATQAGDFMNTTRDTLVETVRQNPIPAALAGIGIAWLLMNRSSAATRRREGSFDQGRGIGVRGGSYPFASQFQGAGFAREGAGIGETVSRAAGNAQHAVGRAVGGAQHAVSDAASAVAHRAGEAAHQVGGALDSAGNAISSAAHDATGAARSVLSHGVESASHLVDATGRIVEHAGEATNRMIHNASDSVGHFAHDAQHLAGEQAGRIGRGLQSTLTTNPLALGAVAMAVGAVVGYALPRTHQEDDLMGEIRDRALEGATHAAHDVVESLQHLAADARDGAKEALRAST